MTSMLRKLLCAFFGHSYYTHQEFGPGSRRVCCAHCNGDWGMNDDVKALIPWDKQLEEIYRMQGYRILKR